MLFGKSLRKVSKIATKHDMDTIWDHGHQGIIPNVFSDPLDPPLVPRSVTVGQIFHLTTSYLKN